MTTHHSLRPGHNNSYRPPVDPLRPDHLRCGCGATAERDGRCRKCRARTAWKRHNIGRRPHHDRPLPRRRNHEDATAAAAAALLAGIQA